MEELDKTTALKKAYAEIILNTTKESAARVMVSDRKSARFHHDLCGTKDEALRLLVRLKQMIDAKKIEGEITSTNQQRQIDVLEAQLQEAEDIITDLRSELRWVRDRLEKAKVYDSQVRNAVNKEEETIPAQKADSEVVVVGTLHPNQEVADTCLSVVNDPLPDLSSLHDVECENDEKKFDGLSVNAFKGSDACESEVEANIISKKLELSRNGCTHRIHALERKVLERNSSSSANEAEQGINEKDSEENLSSGKVNGHEAGTSGSTRSLVLALRASNAEVLTKPSNALGIKKTRKSHKLRRRRKRRWGKPKAKSVRSQIQLIKPCQSQSNLIKPLHRLDPGLTSVKSNVDPTSGSTNVTMVSVTARNQSSDKDLKSRDEDVLVRSVGEEDSVVPSTKMGSELVNMDSDLKVTAAVSDQISEPLRANVNRLVKYTFQRKRKRGSSNENDESNNLPFKREVEEKEHNAQHPIKPTLSNEPSRETPRLAEVATKLKALSES
ncbi:uncharacterized protein LOC18011625 isoform X2 [Eutrema salsugineum]|uniref:uncharacterized protein LOC18011625 isoform X2 n=1 Tax=Eutrema salsugineum TaxID=72664 RepID=UPI000CED09E5|nr:uncharacterized protein LOC18011625 isoform X2 [Eutrema salsugineum]